jgi:hypothetical protein
MEDPEVFYLTARIHGVASINDVWAGYQHLVPRMLALAIAPIPIDWAGFVLQAAVSAIMGAAAVAVSASVFQLSGSRLRGWLAGLAIVGCPILAESSLGNAALLHFSLVAVLCILLVTQTSVFAGAATTAVLILVGLSDPLVGLLFASAIMSFGWSTFEWISRRRSILLVATTCAQGMSYLANSTGRPPRNPLTPWAGMSRLWWASIIWPAVAVIVLVISTRSTRDRRATMAARYVATAALILGLTAWLLGGLADRYFIAPMMLAAIALTLGVPRCSLHTVLSWGIGLALCLTYAVLAVGAFAPRQFLRDGLAWREAVVAARAECSRDGVVTVRIDTVGGAIDAAPCDLFED